MNYFERVTKCDLLSCARPSYRKVYFEYTLIGRCCGRCISSFFYIFLVIMSILLVSRNQSYADGGEGNRGYAILTHDLLQPILSNTSELEALHSDLDRIGKVRWVEDEPTDNTQKNMLTITAKSNPDMYLERRWKERPLLAYLTMNPVIQVDTSLPPLDCAVIEEKLRQMHVWIDVLSQLRDSAISSLDMLTVYRYTGLSWFAEEEEKRLSDYISQMNQILVELRNYLDQEERAPERVLVYHYAIMGSRAESLLNSGYYPTGQAKILKLRWQNLPWSDFAPDNLQAIQGFHYNPKGEPDRTFKLKRSVKPAAACVPERFTLLGKVKWQQYAPGAAPTIDSNGDTAFVETNPWIDLDIVFYARLRPWILFD